LDDRALRAVTAPAEKDGCTRPDDLAKGGRSRCFALGFREPPVTMQLFQVHAPSRLAHARTA